MIWDYGIHGISKGEENRNLTTNRRSNENDSLMEWVPVEKSKK